MQLTPQHLAEVVDCFISKRTRTDSEKRRATRVEVRVKVAIMPLGGHAPGEQINVLLQDISYLGVGMIQSFVAPPDSHFLIRLPRKGRDELVLMCVVKSCRELADGIHSVGAEFECPVAPNMVNDIQKSWREDLERIQESILGKPSPPAQPAAPATPAPAPVPAAPTPEPALAAK